MYTLLLVDDEEDVIEVIERKVSWEQIGFHVVGHAGNGFKALEMMEDMQPDVVMTDIRMPYMDGLELCSNIRQRFPATKLLLFTGFDDFEYAKEAVHLEIEEYILKPLNLAEITEVFKKLKTKLDDELNEKKNTDILKQYYAASLPVLQSNFYTTLIEGRIPEMSWAGTCVTIRLCLRNHITAVLSYIPPQVRCRRAWISDCLQCQ